MRNRNERVRADANAGAALSKIYNVSHSSYYGPRVRPLNSFSYNVNEGHASYSASSSSKNIVTGATFSSSDKGGGFGVQAPDNPFVYDPPSFTALYNEALSDFNEKYRGSVDLSIDILEAGQTRKMLSVSHQLASATQDLISRFGPMRLASSIWLQYNLAIRPMLSTFHGLAEESLRHAINLTERVRAAKSARVDYTQVRAHLLGGEQNLPWSGYAKRMVAIECELESRARYELAGLTSLNPLSIAWEMTPLSFVFDYLIDVGSYLRNAESSFLYDNRFIRGFVSDLLIFEGGGRSDVIVPISNYPIYGSRSETRVASGRSRQFSRSVLSSYPSPRLPTFDVKLGSSRLITVASLLAASLKR